MKFSVLPALSLNLPSFYDSYIKSTDIQGWCTILDFHCALSVTSFNSRTMKQHKPASGDITAELASLKHTVTQNKQLPRLPASATITRRPINHAPVASPFAGSNVQKVVYVSRKTPVIAAVKRAKKFLAEIERRAMQSCGVDGVLSRKTGDEALRRKLESVSEKLEKEGEEVLVRASGRAMGQALRVGEWFRAREEEVRTKVEVRVGSVSVVDDVVERDREEGDEEDSDVVSDEENGEEPTGLEGGETTMELLRNLEGHEGTAEERREAGSDRAGAKHVTGIEVTDYSGKSKSQRKRKRREYDPDDLPDARLRWIKTVEVAISLRA